MRVLCIVLVLLAAAAAHAQTVQKCVGRGGQVRYQSAPCARGERTTETWEAVPEPEPEVSPRRAAPTRRGAGRTRRGSRAIAAFTAVNRDACADARAYRDEAERRAGLSRNYELLSTVQRRVFDACR